MAARGSIPALLSLWHVAQATLFVEDSCSSKNNAIPSRTLSAFGWLFGGASGGGKLVCAMAVVTNKSDGPRMRSIGDSS